ncbi:recombinase family protein [Nocardia brasiliensis]|uniref:recombinase family protein n=1 Tax=Nocardia brasiliensis TaxID=37326 RepID=UPI002458FD6C|nr:recombinase family protein [Nocardia brasiliensis]
MTNAIDRPDGPDEVIDTEVEFTPAVLFLSIAASPVTALATGDEPIKIQVQREAGFRLADQQQLGIIKEFVEIGAPATSLRRRPVLRNMLTYLQQHPEVRFAIFPGPHRFSREVGHSARLQKRFRQLRVGIMLATGAAPPLTERANIAALMAGGPSV